MPKTKFAEHPSSAFFLHQEVPKENEKCGRKRKISEWAAQQLGKIVTVCDYRRTTLVFEV